jgi:membrane protein
MFGRWREDDGTGMVDLLKTRLRHLKGMFGRWREDNGSLLAAAMAYYATFSFFPMLLVMIAGLGFVLQFSAGAQDAQTELLQVLARNTSPALAENVQAALSEIRTRAVISGPLGIVALLFAAAVMFTHVDAVFDRVWNTERRRTGLILAVRNTLLHRFRAFLMLLAVGFLVFIGFIVGMAAVAVQSLVTDLPLGRLPWNLLQVGISVGLNWLLFTITYKVLPKVKVRWSEASRGGNLAAVLWEIARQLLGFYVMGKNYGAYGLVGSMIVLMLWLYIACSVLLLGAEYVRVIRDDRVATERSTS